MGSSATGTSQIKWTREQSDAITTTGHSLLVSAAAGSGKTAVLAERCAHLVCDAKDRCDVDELLVVTFTKAAAAEMRTRIEAALRKRLDANPDDHRLAKQLMLLQRAQITTLHGFCTTVLRQYFHVLGLDPNFRVLDEEEVSLLRQEIARDAIDDRYENDTGHQFQQLIDQYCDGSDETIRRRILHLHDLLCSVVEPEQWLSDCDARVAEAINAHPLVKSRFGQQLARMLTDRLSDLDRRWKQLAQQINAIPGLEPYVNHVGEMLAAVSCWRDAFKDANFEALGKEITGFEAERLPTIRNAGPEKEAMKSAIDELKKEMKDGAIRDLCRFTQEQWRDGLKRTQSATAVLVQLVRDFRDRFAAAKRDMHGVDFSDLERFALKILRDSQRKDVEPSAVARGYHRQFKHVLVDEYQDINEVQDAILKLVSHECVIGEPQMPTNLFSVGDVKQSIYRFRLAQPNQFLARYDHFKTSARGEGRVIDLSSNFRSRGPLLDVINAVFERVMTKEAVEIEYDQSHRLVAGAKFPPAEAQQRSFGGAPVELHLLPEPPRGSDSDDDDDAEEHDSDADRTEREAAFVAKMIRDLVEPDSHGKRRCVADKDTDGSATLRPISYKDVVILLRSMRHKSQQFAAVLRAAGIPVHSESGTGFFESMEIRDMLSLLRVLDNQQQDIPLAAVLRSPLAGLARPEECLARVRLAYPDAHAIPFHRAVVLYAQDQDDELAAQLKAILNQLAEWRRLAHQRPLAEVLWKIYDRSGYLAFCAGMNDPEQRVANLIDFHQRARQFGTFQRQGLNRFMDFLESLEEESDLGQPSVASEADDVVRIMSVHRSKGLEFPVVFLPDLGKRHNLQDASGSILIDREAGIGLMVADTERRVKYPSLSHVLVQERIKRQSLAEELRVLYVAMTRAKEHLVLVGTCKPELPGKWKEQWTNHVGPLPTQRIISSRTMLDWIGPAAAAMSGARLKHRIELVTHDEAELAECAVNAATRPKLSDQQLRLARLEPLPESAELRLDGVDQVRRRLTARYPFKPFTELPAVRSVGSLTKTGRLAPGGESASRQGIVPFETELDAPKCVLSQKAAPAATEVGVATHLLLEHMDFSRPCDLPDLRTQTAQLIQKKLLTPALSDTIDLNGVLWLMSTPLGALLRANAKSIRRELSIYFPQLDPQTPSNDPMDRVMIRGRVDVLITDAAGVVIADYKTDRVTKETVDARSEFYRPQVASYRDAMATILKRPVNAAYLAFLTPRILIEL